MFEGLWGPSTTEMHRVAMPTGECVAARRDTAGTPAPHLRLVTEINGAVLANL